MCQDLEFLGMGMCILGVEVEYIVQDVKKCIKEVLSGIWVMED